jgi:hypothetical protein
MNSLSHPLNHPTLEPTEPSMTTIPGTLPRGTELARTPDPCDSAIF